jgi:hypothetical protein
MTSSTVLANRCPACKKHWALSIIDHPSGKVVLCRYCSAVRAVSSRPAPVAVAR